MARNPAPPVPAPAAPKAGLKFRLEPTPGPFWVSVSVTHVNSRSFYASVGGKRERRLLAEWTTWLADLCTRGTLFLGANPVMVSGVLPSAMFSAPREDRAVLHKRLQSARRVARNYTLDRRSDVGGRWSFSLTGGTAPYTVTADPTWATPPTCDCPDALNRRSPWCKHSMAVLITCEPLRCQLLDVLLEAP